jgi:hypothetical protein
MAVHHVEVLAHHALLLAIPAFVPAIVVAGVVIVVATRDRRRGNPEAHSEHPGVADEDESP